MFFRDVDLLDILFSLLKIGKLIRRCAFNTRLSTFDYDLEFITISKVKIDVKKLNKFLH